MKSPLLSVLSALLLSVPAFGAAAIPPAANGSASRDADPVGVYKWTTPNRNNQPQETTLTIARDKGNQLTGTLTDRSGTVAVTDLDFRAGVLTFSVVRETPSGKMSTVYTGELKKNGELALASERPDPAGTAPDSARALAPGQAQKVLRAEINATRTAAKQ